VHNFRGQADLKRTRRHAGAVRDECIRFILEKWEALLFRLHENRARAKLKLGTFLARCRWRLNSSFEDRKHTLTIVNVWAKAHYRTSGELHSSPRAPSFCCKRPDIDNYRLLLRVCVWSLFWMCSNAQRFWKTTSSYAS